MNSLLKCTPEGGLLQSLAWADVYRARGHRIISIEGGIYGIVETLPFVGSYLYVPRLTGLAQYRGAIIAAAHSAGCRWVRTDLLDEDDRQCKGLCKAPHDMQPSTHLIMDLQSDEEALLARMKSKTRYNIRLAQKKGVVIHSVTVSDSDFPAMLDVFYEMVEATARRKGVQFHDKQHYRAMFDSMPENMIALFVAEVDGGVFLGANIVTFYGDTVTYLHGATGDVHRNYMAPFLLQWSAMRAGIGRGMKWYDFGGVYPETDDVGKRGVTNFKRGFSPKNDFCAYPGTYDIVIYRGWYVLYRILQKVQKILQSVKK